MKKIRNSILNNPWLLILAILWFSCKKSDPAANNTITASVANSLSTHWLGFGFNQYPLDRDASGNDIPLWSDQHWVLDTSRIGYIKPSLVRINLYRNWFNPSGIVGNYIWNSPAMLSFYKVIDWYKSKHIPVMTGLWGLNIDNDPAFYTSSSQNSFQQLQTDLFNQLYNSKGYTNISFYTPTNEPKGTGMAFSQWSQMMHNTFSGFKASALPVNLFSGADSWGDWTSLAATNNSAELSAYDHHYYLNAGSQEVISGNLETTFKSILNSVQTYDPGPKPVFLSESGFINADTVDYWYKIKPVATNNPTSPVYGLLAFDYGMQVARSGQSAALAWCLDGFDYQKDSGMWNLSGQSTGTKLRPWFYTWAMLCRYFPAGGIIYPVQSPSSEVRIVAIKQILGARANWSFAIVNWGNSRIQVNLNVPGWQGGVFSQYSYTTSPGGFGDGSNLGLSPQTINIASLQKGFSINVPAMACILLTSMDNLPIVAN